MAYTGSVVSVGGSSMIWLVLLIVVVWHLVFQHGGQLAIRKQTG